MTETILEKIKHANDDYHEAIDEAFADEDLPTNVKAELGNMANSIFNNMKNINEFLKEYYPE